MNRHPLSLLVLSLLSAPLAAEDFSKVEEDFATLLDHFEKFKKGYPKKFTLN